MLRKGREEREEEEGKKNVGKDYKWEGKGGRMEKGEEESCLWGKGGSTVSDIIVKRYILTLQLLHLCIHKRGGGTAKHYIFEKTQKKSFTQTTL